MKIGTLGGVRIGLALLAGLALAQAQPDPESRPPQRPPLPPPGREVPDQPVRPGPAAVQGVPMLERIGAVLTDEQRLSAAEFAPQMREKIRDLEPRIQEARRALIEESVAEEFRETAVRRRAIALATLEAERAVIMAKALSMVDPPLTADQRAQIKRIISTEVRPGQIQQQIRRQRPEVPRDENDLPIREEAPRRPRPQTPPEQ